MVDAYVVRKRGYFGKFGGQYVPETLMPALHELEAAYDETKEDPAFQEELESYYRHYGGRPTPLYFARRLTDHIGGAQIYLKRGCLVPMHSHESEQMTYILQGALKFLIAGEEIVVREGEVLHIPSWVEHQAEALDDTFELDVFSPIRQDWLDHTDDYFHR